VVGFGGEGRVDSTADDNLTWVANIYVEVAPHCSVAVGLQGDIIKYYLCIEFRFLSSRRFIRFCLWGSYLVCILGFRYKKAGIRTVVELIHTHHNYTYSS
jgi:hypothetical protein